MDRQLSVSFSPGIDFPIKFPLHAPTLFITRYATSFYCSNCIYRYRSYNQILKMHPWNQREKNAKTLLTLFLTSPGFLRVCSTNLLKTLCEKEKLLVTSNFSFSHKVFIHFEELSTIFIKLKIVICELFQFRRV